MKFATLPFCAIAFAALSIAQVALAHFELMTVEPVLLTVSAYSALIAAGVSFDRRSQPRFVTFAQGRFGTDFVPDPGKSLGMNLDDLTAHITGTTGTGMTSSLMRPIASEWIHFRNA